MALPGKLVQVGDPQLWASQDTVVCWGLQTSGRWLVEEVTREDCRGRWHLGRALKDREVFGRQEVGVWGREGGTAGAKVGCKEARVALEGARG